MHGKNSHDTRFLGYYWEQLKAILQPATPFIVTAVYSFVLIFERKHYAIFQRGFYEGLLNIFNLDSNSIAGEVWVPIQIGLRGVWYLFIPLIAIAVLLAVTAIFPRTKKVLPQHRLADFGFRIGIWPGWRDALIFLGIMVPFVVFAVFQKDFSRMYPLADIARTSLTWFIIWEALHLLHMFGWEFLNRGFLLFGLEKKMGYWAILATAVPFALLHLGKPELEAYGSFIAAIALGWVALRTRSFLPGVLLHWSVAFTLDVLAIITKGGFTG